MTGPEMSTYSRCASCTLCDGGGCPACLGDLLDPPPPDPAVTALMRAEYAAASARRDAALLRVQRGR